MKKFLPALALACISLGFLVSCNSMRGVEMGSPKCTLTPIHTILENPEPFNGRSVCTRALVFRTWSKTEPGYAEGGILLVETIPAEVPDDIALAVGSFDSIFDEDEFLSRPNGARVTVSGVLSIMEDCWQSVELGESDDPCIPFRRPIFIDDLKMLSDAPP